MCTPTLIRFGCQHNVEVQIIILTFISREGRLACYQCTLLEILYGIKWMNYSTKNRHKQFEMCCISKVFHSSYTSLHDVATWHRPTSTDLWLHRFLTSYEILFFSDDILEVVNISEFRDDKAILCDKCSDRWWVKHTADLIYRRSEEVVAVVKERAVDESFKNQSTYTSYSFAETCLKKTVKGPSSPLCSITCCL